MKQRKINYTSGLAKDAAVSIELPDTNRISVQNVTSQGSGAGDLKKMDEFNWGYAWEILLFVLIMGFVIFGISQAIGCLPFSPWVLANNGNTFLCVMPHSTYNQTNYQTACPTCPVNCSEIGK